MTEASPIGFDGDLAFPMILSGPSGAGKTSLRNRLLTGPASERFLFSVSMTTRRARPGETEGLDYRFVDRERFETLVSDGRIHPSRIEEVVKEVSMIKALCGDLVNKVMYDCLQFHGGTGYMRGTPIERMARDARVQSIGGGATELMFEEIAKRI